MVIEYKYEEQEFIRGYRRVLKKTKTIRSYDIILYIFCIAASFFLSGMFRILLMIAGLIGIGGLLYQTYMKPKKIYENVEMFREDYKILIDDRGIEVITKGASGLHLWDKIQGIESEEEFFFVKEENGGYLFLPKRAFNESQLSEFEEIIQKRNISDDGKN